MHHRYNANVNYYDADYRRALHYAALGGTDTHLAVMQALLANDPDIDCGDVTMHTPFLYAHMHHEHCKHPGMCKHTEMAQASAVRQITVHCRCCPCSPISHLPAICMTSNMSVLMLLTASCHMFCSLTCMHRLWACNDAATPLR